MKKLLIFPLYLLLFFCYAQVSISSTPSNWMEEFNSYRSSIFIDGEGEWEWSENILIKKKEDKDFYFIDIGQKHFDLDKSKYDVFVIENYSIYGEWINTTLVFKKKDRKSVTKVIEEELKETNPVYDVSQSIIRNFLSKGQFVEIITVFHDNNFSQIIPKDKIEKILLRESKFYMKYGDDDSDCIEIELGEKYKKEPLIYRCGENLIVVKDKYTINLENSNEFSKHASRFYDESENQTDIAIKNGLIVLSARFAEKALEKDPDDVEAHFILGRVHFFFAMNAEKNMDGATAEKEFEFAVQNDPTNYLYYYYLGKRQQLNKKYSQARTSYNTSIKLNNKFDSSYYNLGLTCMSLSLNKEALSAFRSAHTVNPQHAKSYLEEARLLSKTFDDKNGAVTAYEEVISLEPDNIRALIECGSVYAALGKYSNAEEKFRKAIAQPGYKEDPMTYYNLSTVLYNQNKFDEALKYAGKAYGKKNLLRNNNEKAMIVYNYAWINDEIGNKRDAAILYSEVSIYDPLYSKE